MWALLANVTILGYKQMTLQHILEDQNNFWGNVHNIFLGVIIGGNFITFLGPLSLYHFPVINTRARHKQSSPEPKP